MVRGGGGSVAGGGCEAGVGCVCADDGCGGGVAGGGCEGGGGAHCGEEAGSAGADPRSAGRVSGETWRRIRGLQGEQNRGGKSALYGDLVPVTEEV